MNLSLFPTQDRKRGGAGGAGGDDGGRDRRQAIVFDVAVGGEIKTAVSGNISLADNGSKDAAGPILNKAAIAPEGPMAVAGAIHGDVSLGYNGRADDPVGVDLGRAVNGHVSGGHDGAVDNGTVEGQIPLRENDLISQVAGAVEVEIAAVESTRGLGSSL